MNGIYCTTYCNHAHRMSDGKPVEHECRILLPEALRLEKAGDFAAANALLTSEKHPRMMRRGVSARVWDGIMSYHCFTRTWWKENPAWPNGLEPGAGKKKTIAKEVETEDEAREICREYNRTHKPGRLSRKAEFEES